MVCQPVVELEGKLTLEATKSALVIVTQSEVLEKLFLLVLRMNKRIPVPFLTHDVI